MQILDRAEVRSTLKPSNHPYLNGAWTPLTEEVTAVDLDVIEGAIPHDLDGIYLRNTENQVHQPLGRYHPFDGDGMIHQIEFQRWRRQAYRNRWVRTRCFAGRSRRQGDSLWGGLMPTSPGTSKRPGFGAHGSLKDSSSTDIIVHAGKAISTFYQCGEGYRTRPRDTRDRLALAPWVPLDGHFGASRSSIRTHRRADVFQLFEARALYALWRCRPRTSSWSTYVPVPLPGPRLPHDMTFSQNWAIVNDLPMFWDAELLKRDIHAARLHEGVPVAVRGLFRAKAAPSEIRWFEAAPTYILHFLNAYEEGDEVVMDAYFQDNPTARAARPTRTAMAI